MTTGNYLIKCPTLNKRKRDNFTFHCSLILLFSSQGIQYRGNRGENIGAFFCFVLLPEINGTKLNILKKWKKNNFVLFKMLINENFTDKQESS